MELQIQHGKLGVSIAKTTKSAIGKRGFVGGIEVDLSEIPAATLEALLWDAVIDRIQDAAKKAYTEKSTQEEMVAAMNGAYDILKNGAVAADKAAKGRNKIREVAKTMLKKLIRDNLAEDQKLDNKELTAVVAEIAKNHTKHKKTPTPETEGDFDLFEVALAQAAEKAKADEVLAKTLAKVTGAAPKAPTPKPAAPKVDKPKAQGKGKGKGGPAA